MFSRFWCKMYPKMASTIFVKLKLRHPFFGARYLDASWSSPRVLWLPLVHFWRSRARFWWLWLPCWFHFGAQSGLDIAFFGTCLNDFDFLWNSKDVHTIPHKKHVFLHLDLKAPAYYHMHPGLCKALFVYRFLHWNRRVSKSCLRGLRLNKTAKGPLPTGYRPELDVSKILDPKGSISHHSATLCSCCNVI